MQQFANGAQSTLSSGIAAGATSLAVASAAKFPTSGNFQVIIDAELFLVTAVSGTTFTVSPGQEGTTQASHASGVTVTEVLTAQALRNFRGDNCQRGAAANLPAAGNAGVLYRASDDLYKFRDNGAGWDAFGPLVNLTPPVWTGYGWTNQGGATLTQTANGSAFLRVPWSAGNSYRLFLKPVPVAPYTYTAGVAPLIFGGTTNVKIGLALYNSGAGNFITFNFIGNDDGTARVVTMVNEKWTNTTTFSANYSFLNGLVVIGPPPASPVIFLRIVDDNSQRHFQVSTDGLQFIEVANQSRSDFITPTHVGLAANNPPGAGWPDVGMRILSLVG